MVIAALHVLEKLGRSRFFQKTFLLVKISMEVVFVMSFVTFSNVDIQFAEKKLMWRIYTTAKALSTIQRKEFIKKEKFAKKALDKNIEAFRIHVSSLSLKSRMTIYPTRKV